MDNKDLSVSGIEIDPVDRYFGFVKRVTETSMLQLLTPEWTFLTDKALN